MYNKDVTPDEVKLIVEGANWKQLGIKVTSKQEAKKDEAEKPVNEGKEQKVISEEVECCPLCGTKDVKVSDEKLMEHASEMFALFESVEQTLNESVKDEDEDSEDEDLEDEDEDEVDEDEDDE